jgi:hypothetical protein
MLKVLLLSQKAKIEVVSSWGFVVMTILMSSSQILINFKAKSLVR